MAVDEALLREVREPVLRIYDWNVPAVSLGYFQPAALAPAGRPFVRRYTGGGLVDHAHDVTYTIVLPRAHPGWSFPRRKATAQIHHGVQAALAACGIASELTPAAQRGGIGGLLPEAGPFDIVAGARKLSGAAQRRTREGLLHQGSILLPDPARNADLRAPLRRPLRARWSLPWPLANSPSRKQPRRRSGARPLRDRRVEPDRGRDRSDL